MSDLISRQAAIELAMQYCTDDDGSCSKADRDIRELLDDLENLPSAQPHITHCAECIHWQHSAVRKSYCEVFDWVNRADDFCSFAERKDGD